MRALHQYGVAIPGEISVIGYDDTAESAWYQPPLTTVRQDLHYLGAQSVERMLARLQDEEVPDNALETMLVIRETTAPPADERVDVVALSRQLQEIARRLAGK